MKGTNRSLCTPSLYKSSGSLSVTSLQKSDRFEVEMTVTLFAKRLLNRRCIIMASATSVT